MCVLRGAPSLSLLQMLTEPLQRPAAILSVAQACSLLIGSDLEHLVVQPAGRPAGQRYRVVHSTDIVL